MLPTLPLVNLTFNQVVPGSSPGALTTSFFWSLNLI